MTIIGDHYMQVRIHCGPCLWQLALPREYRVFLVREAIHGFRMLHEGHFLYKETCQEPTEGCFFQHKEAEGQQEEKGEACSSVLEGLRLQGLEAWGFRVQGVGILEP